MKRLKASLPTICLIIVIGTIVQWITSLLGSDFIDAFLERDLVTILIALLAINVTTISVIISKMQELSGQGRLDQTNVIDEMQFSITEQVILIIIGAFLLVIKHSAIAQGYENIIQIGLISVLIYAIWILHDTGSGIFVIARVENKRLIEKNDK